MNRAFPSEVVPRLGKFIRLLASDRDGECLAAARALGRTLDRVGASFHDLAARLETEPREVVIYRETPPAPRRKKRVRSKLPPLWQELDSAARSRWLDAGCQCADLNAWQRGFVENVRSQLRSRPDKTLSARQLESMNGVIASAWAGGLRL